MVNLRLPYRKLYKLLLVYILFTAGVYVYWNSNARYENEPFHGALDIRSVQDKNGSSAAALRQRSPPLILSGIVKKDCSTSSATFFPAKASVCYWLKYPRAESEGRFVNYDSMFAKLNDVVVNPLKAWGRRGGEDIENVLNQAEDAEYLHLDNGYFTLKCKTRPNSTFKTKDHLVQWVSAVDCNENAKAETSMKGMTLAVMRYEYVNLYHTMTDFYNAFLMMLAFDRPPDNVTILWVDSHPKGSLDSTWEVLFGNAIRAGHLDGPTQFDDLVWSIQGYNSPLNQHSRPSIPYAEEFRNFFLSRHEVSTDKELNCDKLNVVIVFRRDYLAHPRNAKGIICRKIENEGEIIENMHKILPNDNVTSIQLDLLSMHDQLELIANTDILLGMHGAALSHTLFLPKHAGLIEFYPIYWPQANRHFRVMAAWRGLKYQTWKNHEGRNEKQNYFTYIPPRTVNQMLLEMKMKICNDGGRLKRSRDERTSP